MGRDVLGQMWREATVQQATFDPDQLADLPEPARRYLTHAIAAGTPLFLTARLRMHGEIKLKSWLPFEARQVIRADAASLRWEARVQQGPIVMTGYDQMLDGLGQMRWRIFGLLPLVKASGPDVTRSAAGRLAGELCWLPTAMLACQADWSAPEPDVAVASVTILDRRHDVVLRVGEDGGLKSIQFQRWGDPGGGPFREETFGGDVRRVGSFQGLTIPTEMSLGWFYGKDRYEKEGEFFRVKLDSVEYR